MTFPLRLLGRAVLRCDRVASTNDLLHTLAARGAGEGTVVVAREQTAGRGRLGRMWASPRGGLWFSVLLRPSDPADARLGLMVAVGVAEALRTVSGADVRIKWPNDLVLAGRKVGGILVEVRPPWAIVGIGVNVNVDPLDLPIEVRERATSLAAVSGRECDLADVLAGVLDGVDEVYAAYGSGTVEDVLERWRDLNITLGRFVEVRAGDRVVEGTALDIDGDGALLVAGPDGQAARVLSGDVTILAGGGRP
jgi:BirA family biotin operon repressor/biotin-[acetyl-CoA-carboxylase] ligase